MMNRPSIVAPGGSYQKAVVAAEYWADEVYVGVPFTSLRMRQNKIKWFEDLKKTIDALHERGKKALLTMNIFPRNSDIKIFESVVEQIADVKVDAIIFSDIGTYTIIRKYFPDTPLHLSTQTSTLNYEAAKFWYDLGVKRIVCARELHIDEIKEIKKHVPGMELEIFVHGAMCMSYSGRCLLGDYMAGRSWNKGECSHSCRYKYKVWLEEARRPGQLMEIGEDENWSYILSSKDLCTIDRLEEILPYVDAIKIEGRSKSEFYVASVVSAYKHVRDAIIDKTEIKPDIKDLVNRIPHRAYRNGFLFNDLQDFPDREDVTNAGITKDSPGPLFNRNYFWAFLPETMKKDGKTYTAFIAKEVIQRWDTHKFLAPDTLGTITIVDIIATGGQELEKADCNMKKVFLLTDREVKGWEILFE